jgi:hypothetical protein
MHIVVVNFGPAGQSWPFYFHTAEDAEKAAADIQVQFGGVIADDFGQNGSWRKGEVHGVLLRDPELTGEPELQQMTLNMQNQQTAQQRVMASQPQQSLMMPGQNPYPGMFGRG